MKKYTKPTMTGELFVANEYVGACWIVECNVPGGSGTEYLYNESNGVAGLQTTGSNPDKLLLSSDGLSGCNQSHIGVISSETESLPYNGYWVYEKSNGWFEPTTTTTLNVYWWDEDLGTDYDYHATATPNTAVTNPNAS